MIDAQTISIILGALAGFIATGIGGYMLARSQARAADAQAKATADKAKDDKDTATDGRWKQFCDAILGRLERSERRADDCDEDRMALWQELKATKSVVHEVKQEVNEIKQNGNH